MHICALRRSLQWFGYVNSHITYSPCCVNCLFVLGDFMLRCSVSRMFCLFCYPYFSSNFLFAILIAIMCYAIILCEQGTIYYRIHIRYLVGVYLAGRVGVLAYGLVICGSFITIMITITGIACNILNLHNVMKS